VPAVDSEGRTIWIADARRDGKRFIMRADEKLKVCNGTATKRIISSRKFARHLGISRAALGRHKHGDSAEDASEKDFHRGERMQRAQRV